MDVLSCPKCGAELTDDTVDTSTGLVTCGSCDAVFTVGESAEPPYDSSFKDVPTPDGVTITKNDHELIIARKIPLSKAAGTAFFALAWNGVIFGGALPSFLETDTGAMALALLPFIVIGIGIAYYAAILLVNRTYVSVSGDALRITTAPLPWFGNAAFDGNDIKQLFVRKQHHRRSSSSRGSRIYYTYDLTMVTTYGERRKILPLEEPHVALFFERTIEEYFGIKDGRVAEEMQFQADPAGDSPT